MLPEVAVVAEDISDGDIGVLIGAQGYMLLILKLDECLGFSTNGLLQVARTCRLSIGRSLID
ncbi:hypothetical protein QJS10_CPA10g01561 [Acorus calamus]|uniref:Uncharacterized protein n=1 Tax=Acorus calamus TaxID=4465 RepID=A0AAV9DXG9_ACOCL|nr:hypothetical protein QJS10_CPA10g01561 [Acorus calamus]